MSIKVFISSIILALVLVGCSSSSNHYKVKNSHSNFSSSADSRMTARVVNIVGTEVHRANGQFSSTGFREFVEKYDEEHFQNLSSTPYGATNTPKMMSAKVRSGKQVIEIDFEVYTTNKLKYNSGEWLLDSVSGRLDPHTAVFMDAVSKIVNKLNAEIIKHGWSMSISAEYTGGADADPITNPIPYSSRIGSISEVVTINEQRQKRISVRNGGYINTNEQLALVRAKAVSIVVDDKVAPIKLNNSYKVELSNMTGEEYRFVKVKLQIKK